MNKYELTQTKNGKRVYSETFNTFEDAQNMLKRWYGIDESKDCGNQTISPSLPIRTKQGKGLKYEEAAALDELDAGWTFVFPQNFSRYVFGSEINEIHIIWTLNGFFKTQIRKD